jgi:trehalose-6-phosphate synthase
MSADERASRMSEMRAAVERTDVHTWASSFLRRLSRSRLRSVGDPSTELRPAAGLGTPGTS